MQLQSNGLPKAALPVPNNTARWQTLGGLKARAVMIKYRILPLDAILREANRLAEAVAKLQRCQTGID